MTDRVLEALRATLHRRYRVLHELGRGGAALVYFAQDLKHNRSVALKVLRPEIAVALGVERFLREIQLVAGLNHPHILPLYDSGEAHGSPYYVMPFVEGPSLRRHLSETGPLPLDQALRIASEVCAALTYAHDKGIIHRDIKPENILLGPTGSMVADFGLARAVTVAGTDKLSETGMTVGTPPYMSPEQAGADPRIDARSDVYSLGCVLYEMLAGSPPFTGSSAQAILARHAVDPVPPLRTVRKTVPAEIEQAVLTALEKQPADRFPTAQHFARALQAPVTRRGRSVGRTVVIAGFALVLCLLGWLALMSHPTPRIRRLAVLPLENRTGDSTQGYLVGGIQEALAGELAQRGIVAITAPASVLRDRAEGRLSLPAITRELGVDALVTGSVSRVHDSLQVRVQLSEGPSARTVWSGSLEGDLGDILRLSSNLADAIGGVIGGAGASREGTRLASVGQVDTAAYTLTLKGGYECGLWTAQGLRQGIQLLRKAIDSDPTYAPAYARLASCYSDLSFFGFASPTEANPLARAAIDRALALDSTLGVAFATRGWIRFVTDFDFNGPDADFRRALVLSPGDASIVAAYASYLTLAGRFDDAILQGRNAIALDPLSAPTSINLAWTYFKAHRFDDAIAQLKRTIELEPGYRFAHMELAWNYSEKAMHAEAAAQCDTASHDAAPEISVVFYTCGWVYGRAGRVAEARQMLELLSAFSERYWENPYDFAVLYLGLGERERALGYLRRAVAVRTQSLVFLRVEPQLDPLRSDPAFQALLRQVGVAP